jgi:hypothetical protein
MAIQWGGWHGHLRMGIQWRTDTYTYSTPSITVYIDTYIQCDSTFNFNDNQTATLSGSRSATYNFLNNLQANQSKLLGTQTITNQAQNTSGGPTYTATAALSGAYNGATPSVITSFSLPPRPPDPNSPPYAPTLSAPASGLVANTATTAITFTWSYRDPNGGNQAAYILKVKNPAGTWLRWDGTNFVTDSGSSASVVSGSNGVTIPAGKIVTSGTWQWTAATRDSAGLWGPDATARTFYVSVPPTATVTTPPSPATTPRPPVTWTFSDPDTGAVQNGWQAQIVKSSVYSAAGYNPDNMTGQTWSNSASTTATTATPDVDLPNHTTMRAYVKVNSSPNPAGGLQYSPWVYKQFDLHVPPFPSSVVYPQNGAVIDLAAGFTMTWSNSYYVGTGGLTSAQAAFAIRRKQATGVNEWWNGATWQTTEFFLSGTSASYAFRANEVANAIAWTFAVAIRDGYGGQSPYSNGVTVTGSTAAQVTVLQPTAVVSIVNPVVQWSMYDPENDPQQTYQVRIIEKSVFDLGVSNPLTATAVWDTGELVDATTRQVTTAVDLLNGNTYRAYVRIKTTGVYSGWSYTEFVVSLAPPAQAELTLTVLDDAGAIQIDVQGRDSMMSADTGRSFAGWVAASNSTIVGPQAAYTDAQSNYAMRFKSVAAGVFSVRTSELYTIKAGVLYTAAVSLARTGTSAGRFFHVDIEWLDGASTVISTTVGDTTTTVDTTAQTAYVSSAPPGAAMYARVLVSASTAVTGGEQHDLFDPVFRPGDGIEWSPGGLLGTTSVSIVAQTPYRIVRRGLNIPMPTDSQQVTVIDEEVPNGKEQVYGVITRAIYPNAVLASPMMLSEPTVWTSGWLWLSDPLRPGSGRAWGPQSFGAVVRPVRQGKFRPIGRADAVLTTGIRGLREGSFVIVTASRAERDAYDDLDDRSDVILMRIPPDQGEEEGETLYIKYEGDAPQTRPLPSRTPHRTIEQRWVEQRRPVSNLEYGDDLVLNDDLGDIQVFIGVDTDGTPYFDSTRPADLSTVALARDIDDVAYFQPFTQ